jgi:hypothetical protein
MVPPHAARREIRDTDADRNAFFMGISILLRVLYLATYT